MRKKEHPHLNPNVVFNVVKKEYIFHLFFRLPRLQSDVFHYDQRLYKSIFHYEQENVVLIHYDTFLIFQLLEVKSNQAT